jgi:YfiH family protein
MLPPPFRWHDEHLEVDLPGATALFTTRRGGVSAGPYTSLNLGRWTADAPDAVRRNRERVEAAAGARFAYGRQVHGIEVHQADGPTTGEPADADGIVTAVSGVAPMVLTADCLPVAVAGGGAVGILHGGWRGLAGGIVAHGVASLRSLTGSDGPFAAAIGPGAGPCCYEVSDDVHDAFAGLGPSVRQGRHLDLKAVARRQLADAGVSEVYDCAICTICADPALFFSHRRDGGLTGRQAGVVWRS